jgi:hypothetical protein
MKTVRSRFIGHRSLLITRCQGWLGAEMPCTESSAEEWSPRTVLGIDREDQPAFPGFPALARDVDGNIVGPGDMRGAA